MQFVNKGKPISEWVNDRAHLRDTVKDLASANKLTASAIYNYIESDRDVRVYNGEIFEIKQLRGKR